MKKQAETKTTEKVDLTKLAAEINQQHEQCLDAFRTTLAHAVRTGELLLQAKSAVERGGWVPWVEANCRVSLREAQRYMKLAKEISKLQKEGRDTSAMTLTQAIGHLKGLSPNANESGEASEVEDLESYFRLSDTEREQRVKRHAMSPPALPDSATEVAAKVVDKTLIQVRRAIRAGVIKHIQPKIDDGSLEPADIAMILFESLRAKLTVSMLFDDPETVSPPAGTNGRVALPPEPMPEASSRRI